MNIGTRSSFYQERFSKQTAISRSLIPLFKMCSAVMEILSYFPSIRLKQENFKYDDWHRCNIPCEKFIVFLSNCSIHEKNETEQWNSSLIFSMLILI